MVKLLKEYTDAEKIKLFDEIYRDTLSEWLDSREVEDRDEHYYWESMMETILGKQIWD